MKPEQDKEKKQTIGRKALDNLYSMTGLLLSVACCIALIHVELKIQEHHRLISHSIAYCDQMEKEILRKVRQNDGSWQPRHGRQKGSHSGRWHELEDHKDTTSRQKRASPDNSRQDSGQTTSAEVKQLVKQELRLLQNQICAKDEALCRP